MSGDTTKWWRCHEFIGSVGVLELKSLSHCQIRQISPGNSVSLSIHDFWVDWVDHSGSNFYQKHM